MTWLCVCQSEQAIITLYYCEILILCQYDIDIKGVRCYYSLKIGAVAQLGERMNGIHEVVGSIPSSSTSKIKHLCYTI